jgi:beta-phosphoglucomutase-like phosphatase (HAD superfamily)
MQRIDGILFEPVGCLGEFPLEPFNAILNRVFGREIDIRSASNSYWQVLSLMEPAFGKMANADMKLIEILETQAVEDATVYEDVVPALTELKGMGIKLALASSLSAKAISRFIEKASLKHLFTSVSTRDSANGVRTAPLKTALAAAALEPNHAMFLTDTADGLEVVNALGINSILMMNDPDEALPLADQNPSAGVVSLHELPDFIRLVVAENARETKSTKS